MIEPTSSRSGKNTSMRSTFFSCAIEMTRGVSSSLASRITSPVSGSTMSAAAKAPSSASSATGTASMPACRSAARPLLLIFLPLCTRKSPAFTSAAARSPCRLSDTTHISEVPRFRMTRSTV